MVEGSALKSATVGFIPELSVAGAVLFEDGGAGGGGIGGFLEHAERNAMQASTQEIRRTFRLFVIFTLFPKRESYWFPDASME